MNDNQPAIETNKKIRQEGLVYSINEEEKTASVIGYKSKKKELIIPRSIEHESNEYLITSISKYAFNSSKVKSISFEYNSELRTIEEDAFVGSLITKISIPASVVELKDGWCNKMRKLKFMDVNKGNKRYSSCFFQYIIGKSDIESDDYDTLIVWARDASYETIPETIKIIGTHAFSYSRLKRITIHSNVTEIGPYAFSCIQKSVRVDFEANSKLRAIKEYAFSETDIACFSIPASVTQIGSHAFYFCKNHFSVQFEPNSELQTIENSAFSFTKIERIVIPSSVTRIGEEAFSNCNMLSSVTFEPNSKLQTIERHAFECSNFTRISIPASTIELKDEWCRDIKFCNHVEVESGNARYLSVDGKYIIGKSNIDNEDYDTLIIWTRDALEAKIPEKIKIIGPYAFEGSNIGSILIPSHVTTICTGAFIYCQQLSRVEFQSNSELQIIDDKAFQYSQLDSISIPAHVKTIGKQAFYGCKNLSRIEFQPNSELRTIKEKAFLDTKLASISIPASAIDLEEGWCSGIENLKHVEVESGNARYLGFDGKYIIGKSNIEREDYDMLIICSCDLVEMNIPDTIRIIGPFALAQSKIQRILIPANVTKICENAFYYCKQLTRVVFEPNSKLQTIDKHAFTFSNITSISIPGSVTNISSFTFSLCSKLQMIEIEENPENESIIQSLLYIRGNFIILS